ncbi:cupin domain-containing protein [Haladaptatus cibarius]|uniref:cupin domain-containing protein n=1 Tax=Haladaptatus cibarius TaxID=453847 RepID=UPI000679B224|nr:cupin domain-containing protein [Haladaptatus cibarius]
MEKTTIDDVDGFMSAASVTRPVGKALGTSDMAINYYELAPGDSFSPGLHTHFDQEEVFYVQSGTATFETKEEDVVVEAGEIVRFAPGDYQRGHNHGDERVVALALGAPEESESGELLRDCPECGEQTQHWMRIPDEKNVVEVYCLTCDTVTGTMD